MDEIKEIWKSLKPTEIQEIKLELIVNKEQALKEYAFHILHAYLDGRLFGAEILIKNEIAV